MAAWLASVPLMVVGSQVAHVLAFRLVYPNAHVRLAALLATGHSYMGASAYLPLLLGLVFAAETVGVGCTLAAAVRRRPSAPAPAWAFALLPVLGFTLQELLERWLWGGSFPWSLVLQPTFCVGLLLQLPFAVMAFLVARALLRVAETAGRALRGELSRPIVATLCLAPGRLAHESAPRSAPPSVSRGRGPPLCRATMTAAAFLAR